MPSNKNKKIFSDEPLYFPDYFLKVKWRIPQEGLLDHSFLNNYPGIQECALYEYIGAFIWVAIEFSLNSAAFKHVEKLLEKLETKMMSSFQILLYEKVFP